MVGNNDITALTSFVNTKLNNYSHVKGKLVELQREKKASRTTALSIDAKQRPSYLTAKESSTHWLISPLRGRILFYLTAWPVKKASLKFSCFSAVQINLLGKALWFGYSSISKEWKSPICLPWTWFLKAPGTNKKHFAGHEFPPKKKTKDDWPLFAFVVPALLISMLSVSARLVPSTWLWKPLENGIERFRGRL